MFCRLDKLGLVVVGQCFAAKRGVLACVVLERMLAGLAARRHARAGEPVGAQTEAAAKSTSRSAAGRRFVRQTAKPR